jgi:uncharacterized protein (UPF0332 family)
MTDDNRRAAILAEWERAVESLADAGILADAGRASGAVSRAYYAAFHAAKALCLTIGLQPRSHAGVRSLLGLHFVRTGQLDPDLVHRLSQAARAREDADYEPTTVFGPSHAEEALQQARALMGAIDALLVRDGYRSGKAS